MAEPNESTKSFEQLVQEIDPEPEEKTAYRFSNGRKFEAAGVQGDE
jgi:hypothetical protein